MSFRPSPPPLTPSFKDFFGDFIPGGIGSPVPSPLSSLWSSESCECFGSVEYFGLSFYSIKALDFSGSTKWPGGAFFFGVDSGVAIIHASTSS